MLECEFAEIKGHVCCAARWCKAHARVKNIKPYSLQLQDCYITIEWTTRQQEASLLKSLFGHGDGTGQHKGQLLAPPFSLDHWTSDQRCLFPMLSKW